MAEHLLQITDLPKFSVAVEAALKENRIIGPLWSNFIRQAAAYYLKFPEMKSKTSYDLVGQLMFDKYPAIEAIVCKPWVCMISLVLNYNLF